MKPIKYLVAVEVDGQESSIEVTGVHVNEPDRKFVRLGLEGFDIICWLNNPKITVDFRLRSFSIGMQTEYDYGRPIFTVEKSLPTASTASPVPTVTIVQDKYLELFAVRMSLDGITADKLYRCVTDHVYEYLRRAGDSELLDLFRGSFN